MSGTTGGEHIPFREHPIPPAAHRWALPAYMAVSLLAVATWVIWIVVLLNGPQPTPKPGQGGVSATAALFIAGIAGLGVLTILGIAVAVVLFETTGYENRDFMARLFLSRTQTERPAEPPAEEQGG